MLTTFINGLNNKKYALALQELRPSSIDEAVNLIKREIKQDTTYVTPQNAEFVCAIDENGRFAALEHKVKECEKQIRLLKFENEQLKQSVQQQSNTSKTYNRHPYPTQNMDI